METRADLFLGKTLGEYRLEEFLGSGRTTAVYRAYSEDPQKASRLIVTFFLVPDLLSLQAQVQFQARFSQEAQRSANLRFPSLLPLHGYGELDGYPYLLAPDVQGVTLMTRLKQHQRYTSSQVLLILLPIITTLNYLSEQGLTFPFFNPSNVLILENDAVQLIGLTLTHLLRLKGLEEENEKSDVATHPHLKSIAGTYLGFPEYLAPEVIKGAIPDMRASVYSLGIILFEMLSGQPPFTGQEYLETAQKHLVEPLPSLHEIALDVPIALELVVNRALHRTPDYRFQTLNDLLNACIHVLDVLEKRERADHPLNLLESTGQARIPPSAIELAAKTLRPLSRTDEATMKPLKEVCSSLRQLEAASPLMQAGRPLLPASDPSGGEEEIQKQLAATPPALNGMTAAQSSANHSRMVSLAHRIRERLHAPSKEK